MELEQFVDLNGLSEVSTSYASGGGEYHTFFLQVVYTPGGYSVGSATKSIRMNATSSHYCWGDPWFYKAGIVDPYNSNISHAPKFNP